MVVWDPKQDAAEHERLIKVGPYTDTACLSHLKPKILCQNLCMLNGIAADETEADDALMLRLNRCGIVAANVCVQPEPHPNVQNLATLTGNCSWCRRSTLHAIDETHKPQKGRQRYTCMSCCSPTVPCLSCVAAGEGFYGRCIGMAIVSKGRDAECCRVHSHLGAAANPVEKALAPPDSVVDLALPGAAEPIAPCPWCQQHCKQILVQHGRAPQRSVYRCDGCKATTLPCTAKRHAKADPPQLCFARGHPLFEDKECMHCQGVANKDLYVTAFCSWCCDTQGHSNKKFKLLRKSTSVFGKDLYECTSCAGAGHTCAVPGCTQMAKASLSKAPGTTDNYRCDGCIKDLSAVRNTMALKDKEDEITHTSARAMRELLAADSTERREAAQHGLLRPFLCLLAMGWRGRRALAQLFGWTTMEVDRVTWGEAGAGSFAYGAVAAHAEAWEVLSRKDVGLLAHMDARGGKGTDWDTMVSDAGRAAFGTSRYAASDAVAVLETDKHGKPLVGKKLEAARAAERLARLADRAADRIALVRSARCRSCALGVSYSKSSLCGAFAWARRALSSQNRRSPPPPGQMEDEVLEKIFLRVLGRASPAERDHLERRLRTPYAQHVGSCRPP
jgi:hypothetical protein